MDFLRWLGGIVIFFWVLGLILEIAGNAIHFLLLVAAAVFLYDKFFKNKNK